MDIQVNARSNNKLIQPQRHDTYKSRGKLQEPTACRECGAVYMEGRWSWAAAPKGSRKAVCAACRRVADRFPAGRIEIGGEFFMKHRDEVLRLVRNVEAAEKQGRPLERIMAIDDESDQTVVTTTGIHLARRIGESLARSYQGEFDFRYSDGEETIRVSWSR
ncbi:MAG: BCAM0308 family protein [Candidatus Methylomirabilia bacterium]